MIWYNLAEASILRQTSTFLIGIKELKALWDKKEFLNKNGK